MVVEYENLHHLQVMNNNNRQIEVLFTKNADENSNIFTTGSNKESPHNQ